MGRCTWLEKDFLVRFNGTLHLMSLILVLNGALFSTKITRPEPISNYQRWGTPVT